MSYNLDEDPFSFRQGGGASAASAAKTFAEFPGFIPFHLFLEKYRFDDTVKPHGSGTFGKIFLGTDLDTKKSIVVKKVFYERIPQNPNAYLDNISREVQAAISIDSPHLCKVLGFSVDEARFGYIVMEHINGMDAFDFFKQNLLLGKTNPVLAKRILRDIASGLTTLHESGFAHRDIKLDNVMLEFSEDGEFVRAVIIDFGFTMRICEIPRGSQQGSISYSAPEISQSRFCSEKVDIWAFGVIIFAILHGYYPIWSTHQDPKKEAREVFQKLLKLSESPELPIYTEGNKDVNDLRMICARCLDFDYSARPSAEELVGMLSQ
jgi:serine/threonine protein kinase